MTRAGTKIHDLLTIKKATPRIPLLAYVPHSSMSIPRSLKIHTAPSRT
jgi:hypothetical protein